MTSPCFIYVTVPSIDVGRDIGQAVVEARLAACVNLMPGVRSIYRWQGAVKTGEEVVAIVKTTTQSSAAARALIEDLHPYQTPVIVELPLGAANAGFLSWLTAEVRPADPSS